MRSRFASNLVVRLVGCLLIAVGWMFGPGPARWLIFGGGCFLVGLVAVAFAVRGRGPVQRSIDAVLAVIGAWTVVSSFRWRCGWASAWLRTAVSWPST